MWAPVMSAGLLLSEVTGEIALFAAAGGLLFALDDLLVDLIYFGRAGWRALTVYSRYPRAFAAALAAPERPGRLAVLIPAWDEAAGAPRAKAVVLHDAEDLVHPLELRLFDRLVERAASVQLPVLPLLDPDSRWISGHYADEFAQSHIKELVVREAVGAAIPLAGVGCAIERNAIDRLAAAHGGQPFSAVSLTEDYELGLRLGALGYRTLFVRIPATPGSRAVVASRGHFPADLHCAVRQKARWIGGIAIAGWDRLGWSGGIGERWMRMRDRRGLVAALLLVAGYLALFLWLQIGLAVALGAPIAFQASPLLATLLTLNAWLLGWRLVMRFGFTAAAYGLSEGLRSIPRVLVGNVIAILAARRALALHEAGGPKKWDKTRHVFPAQGAAGQ